MAWSEMTIYGAASKAVVFATGTNQWSYGLDDYALASYIYAPVTHPLLVNAAAQQITRNVLSDFVTHTY